MYTHNPYNIHCILGESKPLNCREYQGLSPRHKLKYRCAIMGQYIMDSTLMYMYMVTLHRQSHINDLEYQFNHP